MTLEAAGDAYLCTDANAVLVDCNAAAEAMFVWSRSELLGRDPTQRPFPAQLPRELRRAVERLAAGDRPNERLQTTIPTKHGYGIDVDVSLWATGSGAVRLVHALYRDVTVPSQPLGAAPAQRPVDAARPTPDSQESQESQDSHVDTLTGLADRDRLQDLLANSLSDQAAGRAGIGLLVLDLDGFRDVNAGMGHDAGDHVLREVARRLAEAVPPGQQLARIGGDEFAVLLHGSDSVAEAVALAAEIRERLERPFELDGVGISLKASMGIATGRVAGLDSATLLREADVAMYRAKSTASGWAVFDERGDESASSRLVLAAQLRAAINDDHLAVAYQPITEAASRRPATFEALARWHHPERGPIPPDQFVALAEDTGLITALTRNVLQQATRACARWRAAGHDVRVAVNLSVKTFAAGDVVELVAAALASAQLDAEHLVLEITEGSLADDTDMVRDVLQGLRELGIALAIDDFGTGYSAMAYLKHLPIEELKIDRSFVHHVTSDDRDLSIVRSLIRLAHSLSLRVVAEGVESIHAVELLAGLGCDLVQGYAIAAPLAEREVIGWLDRHQPAGGHQETKGPSDLLIVDDSRAARAQLRALAEGSGWRVREAESAEAALSELERVLPDVVVLDDHLPGRSGVEAVPLMRDRGFEGPILLFTRFLSEAIPSIRAPLDVWPVAKSNPHIVFELLDSYRASRTADPRT